MNYLIDVSHWQDHSLDLSGVIGCIVKATEGTTVDPWWDRHITQVRQAGIATGAYHYSRTDVGVADQVAKFLATAGNVDLYAVDVEGKYRFTKAETIEFIDRMHKSGRACGLYMSESPWYGDCGQDFNWVANYSQEPSIHWDIWQFGPLNGADGNKFKGNIAQLKALGGQDYMYLNSTDEKIVHLPVGVQLYDPTGAVLVKVSVAQDRLSPYGVIIAGASYRLLSITTGGALQGVLVKNAAVTMSDPPAPDCTQAVADAVAAQAATDAEAAALIQDQLNKANADLQQALVDVQEAADKEQERIALAEADRIRAL